MTEIQSNSGLDKTAIYFSSIQNNPETGGPGLGRWLFFIILSRDPGSFSLLVLLPLGLALISVLHGGSPQHEVPSSRWRKMEWKNMPTPSKDL